MRERERENCGWDRITKNLNWPSKQIGGLLEDSAGQFRVGLKKKTLVKKYKHTNRPVGLRGRQAAMKKNQVDPRS